MDFLAEIFTFLIKAIVIFAVITIPIVGVVGFVAKKHMKELKKFNTLVFVDLKQASNKRKQRTLKQLKKADPGKAVMDICAKANAYTEIEFADKKKELCVDYTDLENDTKASFKEQVSKEKKKIDQEAKQAAKKEEQTESTQEQKQDSAKEDQQNSTQEATTEQKSADTIEANAEATPKSTENVDKTGIYSKETVATTDIVNTVDSAKDSEENTAAKPKTKAKAKNSKAAKEKTDSNVQEQETAIDSTEKKPKSTKAKSRKTKKEETTESDNTATESLAKATSDNKETQDTTAATDKTKSTENADKSESTENAVKTESTETTDKSESSESADKSESSDTKKKENKRSLFYTIKRPFIAFCVKHNFFGYTHSDLDNIEATLEKIIAQSFVNNFQEKQNKLKELREQGEFCPRNLFVIDFNGSASGKEFNLLRQKIDAILDVANDQDEVIVNLNSPGGLVNTYGLCASQLQRIRDRNINLVVTVDEVAASGGYLMACVANKIVAAPFAYIGSIGVIAGIPNFRRVLNKYDVDYEQVTAGKYKRTLSVFGENTEEGRAKFKEELEAVHNRFKEQVLRYRPQLDIEKIATGEHWLAMDALELGLIDQISTSDDFIQQRIKNTEHCALKINYKAKPKKTFMQKMSSSLGMGIGRGLRGNKSVIEQVHDASNQLDNPSSYINFK